MSPNGARCPVANCDKYGLYVFTGYCVHEHKCHGWLCWDHHYELVCAERTGDLLCALCAENSGDRNHRCSVVRELA